MMPRLASSSVGLWLGTLVVMFAPSLWAQVEVTATCPWQDRDGYTPIIVTVRADTPSIIELEGGVESAHGRMTLTVPAGEAVRRTLLVPASGRRWSSSVSLKWRTPGQPPGDQYLSPRNYRDFDVVVIDPAESFAVKGLRDTVAATIGIPPDPNTGYRGGSSSATPYSEARFTRWSADQLPDRWQGFPSWITVLVTPAGERALSDVQRGALSDWSNAGGAIFVAAPEQVAGWQALGARVQVVSEVGIRTRMTAAWNNANRSPDAASIPGTNAVPVYGFVTIAVLFAILVGPANLWWCARRGRRHLLLVTTPILSLLASVILLAYGILADGFTVRRSAVQVIALDQMTSRASVWTGMTLFAGLPPSSITLDGQALLVPLDPGERQRNDPPSVDLIWTDADQLARGEWIPARANRQLGLGLVGSEKRRLAFTQSGEEWSVANGFDQPLNTLTWIDANGTPWHVDRPLAPGQSVVLKAGMNGLRHPPVRRLPTSAELAIAAITSPENTTPGVYVATFDHALVPIPGPVVTDVVPVQTWVVGRVLAPATTSKTGF